MIETTILDTPTHTIYHKISSLEDTTEIEKGVQEALTVVTGLLTQSEDFNLIIDLQQLSDENSQYSFQNHSLWAKGFKAHPLVQKHVNKTAMIGPDNEKYRKEKALLDSEKLHFFFAYEDAIQWLGE